MPGGKNLLRTNLALLTVSASVTLTGVLVISFGADHIVPGYLIAQAWFWPIRVIAAGTCGVLLFVAKSIARPRKLRWTLGAIALIPLFLAMLTTAVGGFANIFAYALPALICAGRA